MSGTLDVEVAVDLIPVFASETMIYGAVIAEPHETSISLDQIPRARPLLAGQLRDRHFEYTLIARIANGSGRESD